MNKKQFFRLATLSMLAILFFVMPSFVNPVPVSNQGPVFFLVQKILNGLNGSMLFTNTMIQYVNAFFIWLTIFTVTRFLKTILGWRAAMFGLILLSLFPRFIGASVQNLVDIPFTFFYFLAVTQIFSMSIDLPRFKIKRIILLFISMFIVCLIHPAGSILLLYLFLFLILSAILKFNVKWHKVTDRKKTLYLLSSILIFMTFTVLISSFLSARYFYQIPLTNPFNALSLFNHGNLHYSEIFESKLIDSNNIPYYYLLKYLFITTPIVVLIGSFFSLIFINKMRKEINPFILFMIFVTFLYPVVISLIISMNTKAAWAIYYISVPFLVIIAIFGFESLWRVIDDRYVNIVISIVLFLLILSPLRHNIVTAPATSIYFNEFAGGVQSSYGKYSLDLNAHVPKIASEWLIDHIYDYDIRDFKDHDTILVLTDCRINCKLYFNQANYIDVQRGTYEQFLNGKGVYFISYPDQLDPKVLQSRQWPLKEAVYTLEIEDAPVVSFLKRK